MLQRIDDWDDAYDNGNNIPSGHRWPARWAEAAQHFRDTLPTRYSIRFDLAYGPDARQRYDLIQPLQKPKGMVVFIHGGFWHKLDKSHFTHLSAGCVERGWAFATVSYRLCPQVRITQIVEDITAAISSVAKDIDGPIRLIGHSAGGQLAARMICTDSALRQDIAGRIEHVVSVSGLHDLRPLLKLSMNGVLKIDAEEAQRQSPALLTPMRGAALTCWVGASERSEFLRQNDLLANIWKGLGAAASCHHQLDRHHFNILDSLEAADSALTNALLGVVEDIGT